MFIFYGFLLLYSNILKQIKSNDYFKISPQSLLFVGEILLLRIGINCQFHRFHSSSEGCEPRFRNWSKCYMYFCLNVFSNKLFSNITTISKWRFCFYSRQVMTNLREDIYWSRDFSLTSTVYFNTSTSFFSLIWTPQGTVEHPLEARRILCPTEPI